MSRLHRVKSSPNELENNNKINKGRKVLYKVGESAGEAWYPQPKLIRNALFLKFIKKKNCKNDGVLNNLM